MSPPIGGVRAGYLSAGKDAIPDSEGTHQYNLDEGSGTTINDSIGTLNGTLNGTGSPWTTGAGAGDAYLDLNGTDDYVDLGTASQTALNHFVQDSQGTAAIWINPDSVSADATFVGGTFSSSEASVLTRISSDGSLTFLSVGTDILWNFDAGSAVANEWQFVGATADGSTARLYHATSADSYTVSEIGNSSISTGNETTGDIDNPVSIGRDTRGQDYFDGGVDIPWFDNVARSQSYLQSWVDDIKSFY